MLGPQAATQLTKLTKGMKIVQRIRDLVQFNYRKRKVVEMFNTESEEDPSFKDKPMPMPIPMAVEVEMMNYSATTEKDESSCFFFPSPCPTESSISESIVVNNEGDFDQKVI